MIMQSAANAIPVRDMWGEAAFDQRQRALRRWAKLQAVDTDRLLAVERALRHHGWHPADSMPDRAAYPTSRGAPARAAKEAVLDGVLPRECFNGWPGDSGVRTTTGEQVYACLLQLHAAGAPPELLVLLVEAYGVTLPADAAGTNRVVVSASDDVLAESRPADDAEVAELAAQVAEGNYAVADQRVTAKTRGSAQRVFAYRVKGNYDWKCALTGIATRDFLVAAHIVPWSEDESIRLDPANGVCLSTFVDRAFDTGYIIINDDYSVHVNWDRVGPDDSLRAALEPLDGQRLTVPSTAPPNPQFLRRRLGKS